MALTTEMREFITALSGKSLAKKALDTKRNKKQQALEKAGKTLGEGEKAEIARVMRGLFVEDTEGNRTQAMDERGQEHSIGTGTAVRKGQGIRSEDQPEVQKAFDKIVKVIEEMRSAKDEEGQPLFSADEIADEVLTPLVREKVIPENFVTDQYSEVQKLLGATFTRYKETLEEARKEKIQKKAKTEADWGGAGSKIDKAIAFGGKAMDLKDRLLEKLSPGTTPEETQRRLLIAKDVATTAWSAYSAFSDVQDLASGKAVEDMAKMLDGSKEEAKTQAFFATAALKFLKMIGDDPEKAGVVHKALAQALLDTAKAMDLVKNEIAEIRAKKWEQITEKSLGAFIETVSSSIEIGLGGKELVDLQSELKKIPEESKLREAAVAIVGRIDKALEKALADIHPVSAATMAGMYTRTVKTPAVVDAATEDEAPDGAKILNLLAEGFAPTFKACAPDPQAASFERVGAKIASAFLAKVKPIALTEALKKDAKTGFDMLLGPVDQAARKALGLLGDLDPSEDPEAANAVSETLQNAEAVDTMRSKIVGEMEPVLLEQLERSEEEIAEYERQLVLMDSGGELMAQQQSVEKLIAQMQQDRKQLEFVATLGGSLSGLATGGLEIAGKSTEKVTEKLIGEVAGPLKAAKLILQMAVSIQQAAERWRLMQKFRADLERARKAGSPLSSVVQGFLDNKKEQIAFHMVDDALRVVQIAGAILGSIPEPITLAVGKTISAVADAGSAVNSVVGKIYNETMLTKAWATTRQAMNNPKDRDLGLAALRLNPTLAMHGIAYAGQKGDPIARMVLNSCGLNEHTMADEGTTEKKVRTYLETLLDEDRKLVDDTKVKTNWQPRDVSLAPRDWAIVMVRATRDAVPPLRKDDTGKILDALKKIEAQGKVGDLEKKARAGELKAEELTLFLSETEELVKVLQAYRPACPDGSPHDEMMLVLAQFAKKAHDHQLAMSRLSDLIALAG